MGTRSISYYAYGRGLIMKGLILLGFILYPYSLVITTPTYQPFIMERPSIINGKVPSYIYKILPSIYPVLNTNTPPACIIIAQAIQESGFGKSNLAQRYNNHLGIRRRIKRGIYKYRNYETLEGCFKSYASIFDQPCYKNLQPKTVEEWYEALECCHYAKDSKYTLRLEQLIIKYNLKQFNDERDSYL